MISSVIGSTSFVLVGLVFFFVLFVGIIIWLFRPSFQQKLKNYANIPLRDDFAQYKKDERI